MKRHGAIALAVTSCRNAVALALLIGLPAVLLPPRALGMAPREELELYAYDDLVLVATFEDERGWAACLRLPDDSLRLARIGNYIGKSDGKVTVLTRDRFELVEIVSNGKGGLIERTVVWPDLGFTSHAIDKTCFSAPESKFPPSP